MARPVKSSRPILGKQLAQDAFEQAAKQKSDVVQGLKDLATGAPPDSADRGDKGIEQLTGSQTSDPLKQLKQAQTQGLTPQQQAERKAKEEQEKQFHLEKVKEWEEDYKRLEEEERQKEELEAREAEEKKEQEIVELEEQEARAEVLQAPPKPKEGRGTAFLPPEKRKTKSMQGTREMGRRVIN